MLNNIHNNIHNNIYNNIHNNIYNNILDELKCDFTKDIIDKIKNKKNINSDVFFVTNFNKKIILQFDKDNIYYISSNFEILLYIYELYIDLICNNTDYQLPLLYVFSNIVNNINNKLEKLLFNKNNETDSDFLCNIINDLNQLNLYNIQKNNIDLLLSNDTIYIKKELDKNYIIIKEKLQNTYRKIINYIFDLKID